MKKVFVFVVLFLLCLGSIFGQMRSENRWLVGTWTGTVVKWVENVESRTNMELVLNDNGTGRIDRVNFIFSIAEPTLLSQGSQILHIFLTAELPYIEGHTYFIYRINDQRMVFIDDRDRGGFSVELNKRN